MSLRQVRIAFGGMLAVALLIVGIAATRLQHTPSVPSVVVNIHFFDAAGGDSNGITLSVMGLNSPPAGSHYQGWIINTTTENIFSLGTLTPANNAYLLQEVGTATDPNLLGMGDEVEITQEQQISTTPVGKEVILDKFPAQAIIHIRHLLVSFPSTPGQVGLLVGLRTQTQVLVQRAQQLVAAGTHDPTLSHCLIRSQIAILEGQTNAALPAVCRRLNVMGGDGFGLLSQTYDSENDYLDGSIAHATLAFQQPDATPAMFMHGTNVVNGLTQVKTQAQALDTDLHALDAHFDATKLPTILTLAQTLLGGSAAMAENGSGPAFDSVIAAYAEGQLMANFVLSSH